MTLQEKDIKYILALYEMLVRDQDFQYHRFCTNIFIWLGFLLFAISLFSFFFGRDELIRLLITFEIMFLGNIMFFCFISYYFDYAAGYVIALILLAVAAVETAIGLALLIRAYRIYDTARISPLSQLRLR
jgi:NADH-quinone oxidoreductase subunit K